MKAKAKVLDRKFDAGEDSRCRVLLAEDLQARQRFDDLEVVDPFARSPVSDAGRRSS